MQMAVQSGPRPPTRWKSILHNGRNVRTNSVLCAHARSSRARHAFHGRCGSSKLTRKAQELPLDSFHSVGGGADILEGHETQISYEKHKKRNVQAARGCRQTTCRSLSGLSAERRVMTHGAKIGENEMKGVLRWGERIDLQQRRSTGVQCLKPMRT
jgi:hypothetical protein